MEIIIYNKSKLILHIPLIPLIRPLIFAGHHICSFNSYPAYQVLTKKTSWFSINSNAFTHGRAGNVNRCVYTYIAESDASKIIVHIVKGGYPAALARPTEKRSANWYRDYITTIVQRGVQDLTRIQKLEMLPRLLSMAAGGQTSRLFNASNLGSPFALSTPTIREYLTLLKQVFLIEQLQPWHSNRLSRLI